MKYLLLAALLLTACGAAPVVQEVKVPVYRPCVTAVPARPTFGTRTLAPDASDGEKILSLARDLPVHLKYEAQLEGVIAGVLVAAELNSYREGVGPTLLPSCLTIHRFLPTCYSNKKPTGSGTSVD
ncbi:MAG TPA: hypothetical protein VF800_29895 [Telluria sp.]|jgi:hypothetical protein